MKTIEIDKNKELKPGDDVFLYFKAPGATWLKATEAALVENALEKRNEFRIISIDYLQEGYIIFEIEVLKTNPVVVTVLYIVSAVLAAVAVLLIAGWTFEKAELVVKAPATKAISAAALIIAGLMLFTFIKGKVNVR